MFSLRRLALRALPLSSTPIAAQSRPITSFASSISRPKNSPAAFVKFQRRFASEEATQAEPEADGAKEAQHGESQEPEYSQYSPSTSAYDSLVEKVSDKASQVAEYARDSVSQAVGLRPPAPANPTVFVGNIFFDTEQEDLRKEFEAAGPVDRVKIVRDVRGLSKGFGYIVFKDTASATKAIEMFNERNFEGRRLSVQFADKNSREKPLHHNATNTPSKTLFIGNLAFDMTDRDLNNLFSNIKDVVDVRVAIDRRTGQPRGFAHADFVTVESAEVAYQILNGKDVCGRNLRIDYSQPGPSAKKLGNFKGDSQ